MNEHIMNEHIMNEHIETPRDTAKEIPRATLVIQTQPFSRSHICRQCDKSFIPDNHIQKGSAQYYRCQDCLSSKTILKNVVYSTCIIS